jgi:hypothetical protein
MLSLSPLGLISSTKSGRNSLLAQVSNNNCTITHTQDTRLGCSSMLPVSPFFFVDHIPGQSHMMIEHSGDIFDVFNRSTTRHPLGLWLLADQHQGVSDGPQLLDLI